MSTRANIASRARHRTTPTAGRLRTLESRRRVTRFWDGDSTRQAWLARRDTPRPAPPCTVRGQSGQFNLTSFPARLQSDAVLRRLMIHPGSRGEKDQAAADVFRGFRCGNNDGNTCYANARTGSTVVISTGVCSGTSIVGIAQATLPFAVTTTETAVTNTNGAAAVAVKTETPEFTLWAPMFQYNYKASDLESASRASTASSATAAPSLGLSTTSSAPPDPNTGTVASTGGQGGLSTGAIAGIAVGAAIAGILLAAIVGCLWWRRGRKRRDTASYPAETAGAPPGTDYQVEADTGIDRNELPTKAAWYPTGEAPELEDRRGPHAGWAYAAELPSDHAGYAPNQRG